MSDRDSQSVYNTQETTQPDLSVTKQTTHHVDGSDSFADIMNVIENVSYEDVSGVSETPLTRVETTPFVIQLRESLTFEDIDWMIDTISDAGFAVVSDVQYEEGPTYRCTLVDETENGVWEFTATEDIVVLRPKNLGFDEEALVRVFGVVSSRFPSGVTVSNDV